MSFKLSKKATILLLLLSSLNIDAQIPHQFKSLLCDVDTTGLVFKPDVKPHFKGGYSGLVNYYTHNFRYPEKARYYGIEGDVKVLFVVEKDGHLTSIKATNKVNKELEEFAVEFIKNMPRWVPGEKNDSIVRVLNVKTVSFKLRH
ncbi:energy transducer TonB [Labilibacter marinus]|uniref:energy transducer TonB n=1 Tax=Labilibacter marinus TaxID=1477105 RepID=UPI00094FDCF6|nr:energy transducer TonB [Labilibacter marinus]